MDILQRQAVNHIPIRYKDAKLEHLEKSLCELFDRWKSGDKWALTLYGVAGSGKTYSACALANYLIENHEKEFYFVDITELFYGLMDELKDKSYGRANRMLNTAITGTRIILDDIGAGQLTSWRRDIIYRIIYARHKNKLKSIITTNLPPKIIGEKIDLRIASRITEGDLYKFPNIDRRRK